MDCAPSAKIGQFEMGLKSQVVGYFFVSNELGTDDTSSTHVRTSRQPRGAGGPVVAPPGGRGTAL